MKLFYQVYVYSLSLFLFGCGMGTTTNCQNLIIREKPFDSVSINVDVREYFSIDSTFDFEYEDNAVKCSFVGDYRGAFNYAKKNMEYRRGLQTQSSSSLYANMDDSSRLLLLNKVTLALENEELPEDDRDYLLALSSVLSRSNLGEVFSEYKPVSAVNYIAEKARAVDYVIVNEAHFCGLHRSFTADLLQPLWDEGFRYLALEALDNENQDYLDEKSPSFSWGFFTKEATFGNLIRKALDLGYKILSYECVDSLYLNRYRHEIKGIAYRDSIQAENIFEQTLDVDSQAKTIVHVGYSHAAEEMYGSVANFLKSKVARDILSIDQETMTDLSGQDQSRYYSYFKQKFSTHSEPTVFINSENECLRGDIGSLAYDIQVFHPKTTYQNDQPDWLINESSIKVFIPNELIEKHLNHIVYFRKSGDSSESIPILNFILQNGRSFFYIDKGAYDLYVYNEMGKCVQVYEVEIK